MPLEEEFKKRITRLELDLQEAQRKLIVSDMDLSAGKEALSQRANKIRELNAQNTNLKTSIDVLHREIATLTSEKEGLVQKIQELGRARVKPTPSRLIQSFRLAMDDLQKSLKPKTGESVGYTVSQFDVDLKTAIIVDKEDSRVRLVLPDLNEQIPVESLSTVKFTFSTVPKAEPPDESLVEVPQLLGLSRETALAELLTRGLKQGTLSRQISEYPPGTVIGQYPDGEDLVPQKSSIDLVLAKSIHVAVPLLVGQLQKDAEQILKEVGLAPGLIDKQVNPAPAGTVLSQDPEAETVLSEGDKVDLVVAMAKMISVPDLRGYSLEKAEHFLSKKELKIGSVEQVESSDDKEGIILEQRPEPGQAVPAGSEVSVIIGTMSKVTVPSVIRKPFAEAKEIIVEAGLGVGVVTNRLHGTLDGVVLRQDPERGVKVAKGSPVNLIVAKRKRVRHVLESIKAHPDIRKTGFTYKTLAARFSQAGIDSVEKFQKLTTMSNIEVSTQLKLRNQVSAPEAVKKIIKESLEKL